MKSATQVSGRIYWDGSLKEGTLTSESGKLAFEEGANLHSELKGTLIPFPVNSHTHVGDSFIHDEPAGTLPEIVGPGGFKHRRLQEASSDQVINGIQRSIRFMEKAFNLMFFDFRESGKEGVDTLHSIKSEIVTPVIFGRPAYQNEDIDEILDHADGLGISSISDADLNFIRRVSEAARMRGKPVAMHFSENVRENVDDVLSLNPDLLVHGIEATVSDLDAVSDSRTPVAITPRSNIFYGKRPDYSRFLERNVTMLLGTDNVMVTEPDVFTEMDFLYRYQRSRGRISPENILKMVIDNPRAFLKSHGIHYDNKMFIFFEGQFLNEYDLVTKSRYYCREILHAV